MRLRATALAALLGLVLLPVALVAAPPAHAAGPAPAQPLAIGDSFVLDSEVLGEPRRINVYRPGGDRETPLPVLYMPDGGLGEDFLHIAGLVQVGAMNGTMRPVMLVGIENTERRRDLTGPTEVGKDREIAPRVGGSAAFRTFIADELMPEIERRYPVTGETAIIGESLAGLFVVESLVEAPQLFDGWIAIDPSLWWNGGRLVEVAPARLQKLAPTGGKPERLFLASSDEAGIAVPAAALARALADAPGLRVHHAPMPAEQHHTIYHPAALMALREVFAPGSGD
ncbi:alpha/beta hydrolase [Marilutibacter chinensis]|uniref:Alpha/beta hydrolase n=1 Tax=Marilutibacter chinensis TaxID=2912247 RepID=A0ABS9HT46_9GAMM|nr:alpha/beta hydrolase-fold protein [Lysobacter chinensis]MCF7221517.1 alpha/beta hydrolase [Lysobacter chinensis]